MYYINSFFIYSLFGFIMESDIYKISKSKRHSSIFYGPITTVYGVGIIALILIKKFIIDKLKCKKIFKIIIAYILSFIVLTLIEYIGGNTLKLLFNIDMWNYENKNYNIGKYICLELSLIWGLFGVIYIFYIKKYIDKIIMLIPKRLSYTWIMLFIIDLIMVILTK